MAHLFKQKVTLPATSRMHSTALLPHNTLPVVLSFLWPIALLFWAQHDPFFWDTVQLASKQAHFFYDNGLRWAPLPPVIDSGHPPLLGYYLAVCWSFLGKTLAVSHWAMLPFLLGCHYFVLQIARYGLGPKLYLWAIPVFWLDPVMAGQSVLVSPDVLLVCFMLMSLHGILQEARLCVLLGIIGLCLISMRGMMCAAAILIWQIWQLRGIRSSVLYFFPGFFLGIAFLGWHWAVTGWIGHHPASPWGAAFQRADNLGIIRNSLVLCWRFWDFGRIGEWLIWGLVALHIRAVSPGKKEISLLFILALFLLPTALLYQNLSAHRYLLPLFLVLHFVVLRMCARSRYPQSFLAGVLLFLFSGHFWIYPHGVSMGWDSTFAHLPYHQLHKQGLSFLKDKNIDFQSVGTYFPNVNSLENLMLNGDNSTFSAIDLSKNQYVFVSNIYNDFEQEDLKQLEQNWVLVFSQTHPNGVWLKIFQKAVR